MKDSIIALGLDPDKDHTAEEVKKAWREKIGEHHPDKGGDKDKFLAIMHAYKMISDPSYRRLNATVDRRALLNMTLRIPISFEDAFFGRSVTISYNQNEVTKTGEPIIKEKQDIITLNIMIAPGGNKHDMVFPGKGLRCGEEYGDAVVTTVPANHPRFSIEGLEVVTTEQIPLETLLKGGEITVQTMYGLKTCWISPGTQPGARVPIRRCGVGQMGSHVVIVDPVFPSADQLKQNSWKGLDINWSHHSEDEEEQRLEIKFTELGGLIKW
jgi:DnaJ-class molecular chaperone